jgi:hypothetical protein
MPATARRAVEVLLWVLGALFTGVGALIVWNLVTAEELDSEPIWFLFGAVVYGGAGLLLFHAALRMHRATDAPRRGP